VRGSEWKTVKVGLVLGGRPPVFRHAMNRWMVADRDRIAAMFHDRHRDRGHVADGDVVERVGLLHELVPRIVERPEGDKPRSPVGRLAERRRRLPEPLSKGAGEGIWCVVTGIHRNVRDALGIPVSQPV